MSKRVQVFAHRGAMAVAPENTLPAFEIALAMGVHGIELDVHRSRDGKLAVIHDNEVSRTTNGSGRVGDLTATDLAQLDAGSHLSADFAGVGIPTLDQVLDLVGNRCRVNVEVKSSDWTGGAEADLLVEMIQARNLYDQVLVSSFNPVVLIKLRWLDDEISLGLLYSTKLPPYLQKAWLHKVIQPQALHPYFALVDTEEMALAHNAGCAVNTWTVNEPEEAVRLASLGVDVIMSDIPDQIMAAVG